MRILATLMEGVGHIVKPKAKIALGVGVTLLLLAVLVFGGYWLIRSKIVLVNPLFVAADDVVGVDVSEHQGVIEMEMLAGQDVSFVYIKATEGSSHVDAYFANNWANAQAAGLPRGAYHFFSFDSPGADQAQSFISVVGDLCGSLVPVVDVEWYADKKDNPPARSDVERELRAYLDALEAHYGVKPIIYASHDVYKKYLAGTFDAYPIWAPSTFLPVAFTWGDGWTIWQYCDRGKLDGYVGKEEYIDMNVLSRTASLDDLMVR